MYLSEEPKTCSGVLLRSLWFVSKRTLMGSRESYKNTENDVDRGTNKRQWKIDRYVLGHDVELIHPTSHIFHHLEHLLYLLYLHPAGPV